jgi:hypothetical protein
MATQFYVAVIQATVGSGAETTLSLDVSSGQEFEIQRIQQKSTGAFDILDIINQYGNNLSNASSSNPIDGNFFSDIASDNNVDADLPYPILIPDKGQIQFIVKDTSASSNTIELYLSGKLTTP